MNWIQDRLSTIGGGFGGIMAYLLNIEMMHVAEIALYGLIGSLIGEGVKEAVILIKKNGVASKTTKSLFGLGLAAAAFVVYRMWNTKESLKFFQYNISGLKFRLKNILQPEVIFAVEVYNPNKTSIPVSAFFGNIKQGANVIATFSNTDAVTIGENTTQTISITAKVKAFSLVMAIINKQVNLHKVELEAMLKTGFFDMPIKTTIDVLPGLGGINTATFNRQRRPFVRRIKFPPLGARGKGSWQQHPLHFLHPQKGLQRVKTYQA